MDASEMVAISTLSFVFWVTSYFCVEHFHQGKEWSSRIIAGSHAIVLIILTIYAWDEDSDMFNNPGGKSTYDQERSLLISLGYFVYDLLWCLNYQPEGRFMLLHHSLAITCYIRTLLKGYSGPEAIGGVLFLELTNPLLQARWLIRDAGYGYDTYEFIVADLLFLGMFFLIRIVGGTYFTYYYMVNPRPDHEMKMLAAMLYIVSWGFVVHMGQYFNAKYVRRLRLSSNHQIYGVSLPTLSQHQPEISLSMRPQVKLKLN